MSSVDVDDKGGGGFEDSIPGETIKERHTFIN